MVDYKNGKIYKIVGSGMTYYGSTCEPTLARRLTGHRSNFKQYKLGRCSKTMVFDIIELEVYDIILVELCSCESKDELHAIERHYIENNECINKTVPGRTDREYYVAHQKSEIARARIETKRRKLLTRHCKCGGRYGPYAKQKHMKTNIHQVYEARNISPSV
jgi:hypothetical protein